MRLWRSRSFTHAYLCFLMLNSYLYSVELTTIPVVFYMLLMLNLWLKSLSQGQYHEQHHCKIFDLWKLIGDQNIVCWQWKAFGEYFLPNQYLALCIVSFAHSECFFLDMYTYTYKQTRARKYVVLLCSGYDMSTYIRKYAKYINEKAVAYRVMAFDFCKVKRGKEDGLLRTMAPEKVSNVMRNISGDVI